jgi:hypothetical protein
MADLVLVEDYARWRRAIKELDTGLDKELKQGLKSVGVKVSDKAKAEVAAKGLVNTGELMRKISPTVRAKDVAIVSKAKRPPSDGSRGGRYAGKPFPYGFVYEYGGRGAAGTGPRAFLRPGVEKSKDVIVQGFTEVLDDTARKAGFK